MHWNVCAWTNTYENFLSYLCTQSKNTYIHTYYIQKHLSSYLYGNLYVSFCGDATHLITRDIVLVNNALVYSIHTHEYVCMYVCMSNLAQQPGSTTTVATFWMMIAGPGMRVYGDRPDKKWTGVDTLNKQCILTYIHTLKVLDAERSSSWMKMVLLC